MKIKFLKLPKSFKFPKLTKLIKLPQLPKFSLQTNFNLKILNKRFISPILKYKIITLISFSLGAFITLSFGYRVNFISQMKSESVQKLAEILPTVIPDSPTPNQILPLPTDTTKNVLGSEDYSVSNYNTTYISPTALPTFPPIPTLVPIPTTNPTSANNSANNNSTGNPNCTTGGGEPNSWYSDVYPNPPITTNTGSVEIIAVLRDCFKQTAPVNDTLTVSLISGDPNTQINGNKLPATVTAQNGQANFFVTSQVTSSVTLSVQDTTKSFTVTDINNHNPSVSFTNNTSGNSNCTTGPGVANGWYSDVYPVSPVSTNTGAAVTFSVILRDCNKNTVSSSDTLKISQTSSDAGLTVNGSAPPVNIQASNGQASFSVNSPNAGTVTLTVQDTTNSFTITDTNNHNPSVVFSSSAASPTQAPNSSSPSPTNAPSQAPSASSTPAPTASATSTPAPTQSNSPTPIPTPIPTRP